jgi:aryl-alcohol dehydrogenase-like predicted oxidoreductase
MEKINLGGTGVRVSRLGLGCMLMGTATDEPTSYRMLDAYVGAGGDFLDTANCYAWWRGPHFRGGESEELLSRWLARAGNRDRVFLATKVGAQPTDVPALYGGGDTPAWGRARGLFEGAGGDTVRQAVDGSLRRLGLDHVDLLYIHVDDRSTPLAETLAALDDVVRAGKVRFIGYSNVRTWRLDRIRVLAGQHGWPSPVAVQQQHSYLRPTPDTDQRSIVGEEMLSYLREHDDVGLVAYSPILKSIYNDPSTRREHPLWAQYAGAESAARLDAVQAVAKEIGATGNQVALAWLLHQRDPRPFALAGPRTWEQFDTIMPAASIRFTADQLDYLNAAGRPPA